MMRFAQVILASSITASCSGVYGSLTSESSLGEGVRIVEVRSAGLEIRNIPGYRGMSLGRRVTTYIQPLESEAPVADWKWGAAFLQNEMPLYTASSSQGIDLAWEPSFRGLSLGFDSRSCAILDLRKSSILKIHSSPGNSHFSYHSYETP